MAQGCIERQGLTDRSGPDFGTGSDHTDILIRILPSFPTGIFDPGVFHSIQTAQLRSVLFGSNEPLSHGRARQHKEFTNEYDP